MWKRYLSVLSVIVGIAGFCTIPFLVGVHDLLQTIGQVGWVCIVWFILNSSGTLIFPGIGWWIIMRAEGIPVSLSTALQANLMGFPLNCMTPSMFLGGEPLKTVYIATVYNVPKRRVLATIMVAKFQELGSLILSMIAATALFVWHTDYFPLRSEVVLIVVLAVLTALFAFTFYAFVGRGKPLVRLLTFLARCHIFPHLMARLMNLAEELEELVYTTLTRHRRVLILAQLITWLSSISIFLRPWIFFRALPLVHVSFDQLCLFFVLTNLVNSLTLIPGGLGLFEATMTGYAGVIGLGNNRGAAFAIVNRIADLALFMLGSWLIARHGLARLARGYEDTVTFTDNTPTDKSLPVSAQAPPPTPIDPSDSTLPPSRCRDT